MTDPHQPAAPTARTRPGSVTLSSYLLFAVALLFVINAIVSLATLGTITDVYRDAYQGTEAEGAEVAITIVGGAASVALLVLAVTFVVLALLNNQGRNVSRIITWVLSGIGFLCTFCCTGFNVLGSAMGDMDTPSSGGTPDAQEIERRLAEEMPGWAEPVTLLTTVLAMFGLLAVAILLALPRSNDFFRKPQAIWEPPVPGSAYPGPPAPGVGYPPAGAPGGQPPVGQPPVGPPPAGPSPVAQPPAGQPPAGQPPVTPSGDAGSPPPGGQTPGTQPAGDQPSSGDQSQPPSGPSTPPAS
mgnify:CR=1 FL=1